MVARLTRGRERYAEFEATAAEVEAEADAARAELLELADLDARAYREFVGARRLPRTSDRERRVRRAAVERAAEEAARVPLRTAQVAARVVELAGQLAGASNPNAVSDVGAAAVLAAAAARGALLNVRINLPSLSESNPLKAEAASEVDRLLASVAQHERAASELVETALG